MTARAHYTIGLARNNFDALIEELLRKHKPEKRQQAAALRLMLHEGVTWERFWEVFDSARASVHDKSHEHRVSVVSRECHRIATYR